MPLTAITAANTAITTITGKKQMRQRIELHATDAANGRTFIVVSLHAKLMCVAPPISESSSSSAASHYYGSELSAASTLNCLDVVERGLGSRCRSRCQPVRLKIHCLCVFICICVSGCPWGRFLEYSSRLNATEKRPALAQQSGLWAGETLKTSGNLFIACKAESKMRCSSSLLAVVQSFRILYS